MSDHDPATPSAVPPAVPRLSEQQQIFLPHSLSPTVQELQSFVPQSLLPTQDSACLRCPQAVWQEWTTRVQCYCPVLAAISWDSNNPREIAVRCDGMFRPAPQGTETQEQSRR